jgi:hypothetical protein
MLPGRRLTIHLMLQPAAAQSLFSNTALCGLGTLARVLAVAPQSTAGTRMFRDPDPAAKLALADFNRALLNLLERALRMLPTGGGLDPKLIRLSHEASLLWCAFHDAVERQLAQGGKYASIRGMGSKLPEHAGRLAAILAAFADPEAGTIPGELMAHGIRLAQYYAAEALRLHDVSTIPEPLHKAQALLTWLLQRGSNQIHLQEIYQKGPRQFRDAKSARETMAVLDDRGWIRALPAGTVIDGMGRRECWEMVP